MSIEIRVKTTTETDNIVTFNVTPDQTIEQIKQLIKSSGILLDHDLDQQHIVFTTYCSDDGIKSIDPSMQMDRTLLPILKKKFDPFISERHVDDFYNALEFNKIEIPTVGGFIDAYNNLKNKYFKNSNGSVLFDIKNAVCDIYNIQDDTSSED